MQLISRQDRRKNKSRDPKKSGKINWSFWGGGIVVFAAIAVIVIVFLNSPESAVTEEKSALVTGGSLIGDPNAPITLVEFGDFQWPICANFALGPGQQIIREYVDTGRVNILFRHFPFIGDESWRAAEASECAAEQNRFQEYQETIFVNWNGENQGTYSDVNLRIFAEMTGLFLSQFDECMESGKYLSKITSDREAAIEFGVNSTPTLFLNGVNIGGLKEYGYYRVRLEEALNEVDG